VCVCVRVRVRVRVCVRVRVRVHVCVYSEYHTISEARTKSFCHAFSYLIPCVIVELPQSAERKYSRVCLIEF